MLKRCVPRVRSLLTGACLAGLLGSVQAVTLYDPALGSLPSAQGWLTTGTPGYTQGVTGGTYRFDTTAANAVAAGSARTGLSLLDTNAGFELDFGLRVVAESHARAERGGFSVIVTGTDPTEALELAFWNDRVFAYTASFAHGAEALLDTTATTAYALVVASNRYTLFGNGQTLLSGALVDYSGFGMPYDQPGLLFFGDDTTSASASVELGRIAVAGIAAPVPEPSTVLLTGAGLLALGLARRRQRRLAGAGRPSASPTRIPHRSGDSGDRRHGGPSTRLNPDLIGPKPRAR